MKFGDKYELLESLTTGVVETFVANDKIRGERVLVHILDCEPQKANQPTVQWVLESFRRVAPEPAGLVLETGRYSGTLYAYLVTKLPEDAALRSWVQRYKALPRDTQEFPPPVVKTNPISVTPPAEVRREVAPPVAPGVTPGVAPDVTPKDPARPPGPVTALFREFDLQAKSGPHSPPPKGMEQPSRPLPNVNASADPSGPRIAPPWDPGPPAVSIPRPEPNVSKPADPFRSDFNARTFPTEPIRPPAQNHDGPKAGEFTSFFQGPFRGDRPLETPAISNIPQPEPPRKKVGDFTAVFGSPTPQPEEPPPAPGIAGNEPAGTGFTDFFNPGLLSRTSSTTAPPPSTGLPRATVDATPVVPPPAKAPFIPPPPVSYVPPPAPPIFPAPVPLDPPQPKPPAAVPSALPSSSLPSDGATRAFARPNMEPAPGPPPPPSGPSAYTRVISVRPTDPAADAAGAEQPAPAAGPPMPPMPKFAPPAPPPKPKIKAPDKPAPPKLPKGELPEPPAISYWPLIITLTVIFIIAVLVVLYFVLKH